MQWPLSPKSVYTISHTKLMSRAVHMWTRTVSWRRAPLERRAQATLKHQTGPTVFSGVAFPVFSGVAFCVVTVFSGVAFPVFSGVASPVGPIP